MALFNLTPHPVILYTDNEKIEFQPSGHVVRLEEENIDVGMIGNLPVVRKRYKKVNGLPDALETGDIVIVSSLVGPHLRKIRANLIVLSPDTGPESAVRNEEGRIIGIKRFILW